MGYFIAAIVFACVGAKSQLYYHIIKECEAGRTARYQTLCANCNVIKRELSSKRLGKRR